MSDHQPHSHVDPLLHVDQPDTPDREADARAWAGKAVRDIGHALVGRHASLELIDRVSTTLDALTEELALGARRTRQGSTPNSDWGGVPEDGAEMTSYDERPISGRASPLGLDLHIVRDGDEIVARGVLRAAHEGAPGRSHGGVVAALFDDVYGFVLTLVTETAYTGELSVRYAAGVPIGVPIECRVRLAEREGRKLFMTGEVLHDGQVLATSKATFIVTPR